MFGKIFKNYKKHKQMDKEKFIDSLSSDIAYFFKKRIEREQLRDPGITDDDIRKMVKTYFNKPTLTEAIDYHYDAIGDYVPNTYNQIDHNLPYEEMKLTEAHKQWRYYSDVKYVWTSLCDEYSFEEKWVELNGKRHSDEEAATIAADKWCELIFGWHLQDNGALNENHPGGFTACALATVLGDDEKKNIPEEAKIKAHENFKQYYLHSIQYSRDRNSEHISWLEKNLPDPDGKFEWGYYGFRVELYCDYGPTRPLELILINSGINEDRSVSVICPWKTGIDIRYPDNAVFLKTYQHREEL